jgi:DNA-binding NtrC family response regulator
MDSTAMILVVDDEFDLAESCARLLRRRGYRVVMADSFAAGRAALAASPPAVLVSDVRLPDGDGLDLVRAAGALEPPVPSVVVSGYLSDASHTAAREAGAVACLPKPFTSDALTLAVGKALERRD